MSETAEARYTLADLRQRAGLSQLEVARRMDVGKARVGQIERDFPKVRFNVAASYLEALGLVTALSDSGGFRVRVDEIVPDPRGPREHGDREAVRAGQKRSTTAEQPAPDLQQ